MAWEEIPAPVPACASKPMKTVPVKQKPPISKGRIDPWRQDYRNMRPHGKPGMPLTPVISVAAPSASPQRAPLHARPH